MEKLSIIVPCYNEQETLPLFYQEVSKVLSELKCEYEILLVNDGSRDETLNIIKKTIVKELTWPH